MIAISQETPLQDDVRNMIAELNAYLKPLSPPEFQFQMTAEQMAYEKTTVLIARDKEGQAVGMGSLKLETKDFAEIKRMFTYPDRRGTNVGSTLLSELIELAKQKGVTELALETGEGTGFERAYGLYEKFGFEKCGAFLDYPDSGYSRFYKMKLN